MWGGYKKALGKEAEQKAVDRLIKQGVEIVERNRTMRGGEIDIVGIHEQILLIIEVKSVDSREDVYDYLSSKKIAHLQHSTASRMKQHNRSGPMRIDAVYVYHDHIDWYQNITNT